MGEEKIITEEDVMKNLNKKKIYYKPAKQQMQKTKYFDCPYGDLHLITSDELKRQQAVQATREHNKDVRIKELQEEIADLKAEIELLKAVNQEC